MEATPFGRSPWFRDRSPRNFVAWHSSTIPPSSFCCFFLWVLLGTALGFFSGVHLFTLLVLELIYLPDTALMSLSSRSPAPASPPGSPPLPIVSYPIHYPFIYLYSPVGSDEASMRRTHPTTMAVLARLDRGRY